MVKIDIYGEEITRGYGEQDVQEHVRLHEVQRKNTRSA